VTTSRPRLLTTRFVVVTAAALCTFVAVGMLIPVLPRFVAGPLGGGSVAVGLVVGAIAVTAAAVQPSLGLVGDRRGRRLLVVGGAGILAISFLGYALATSVAVLVAFRMLTGIGEAAIFVGAATAVNDLAPAERRGEAVSYFSVAVYGGLAIGPPLGEWLLRAAGFRTVWLAAAGFAVVGGLLGLRTPVGARPVRADPSAPLRRWQIHRAGVSPGVVLALAVVGYVGFAAFVPLYVATLGLADAGPVFAMYAAIVLTVRIAGARIPDRLGPVRGATGALAAIAAGMATVGLWATPVGLYAGTALLAAGMSLLFPALMPLVVDGAPVAERATAVATFTMFFDIAQGIGAVVLGTVVSLTDYGPAFVVAGGLALTGLVLVRRWYGPGGSQLAGGAAGAG
jgi:MFS family permease